MAERASRQPRRAGVTVAAGMLQKAGLMEYRHGRIKVVDREGLEAASCACYRIIRETYNRLATSD